MNTTPRNYGSLPGPGDFLPPDDDQAPGGACADDDDGADLLDDETLRRHGINPDWLTHR